MMSSSKLSLRLKTLAAYYQNEENIWDIGCDHGLLGLSFTSVETVKTINLVDPSAPVIETLKRTIKDAYISVAKIFIHHKQGQEIKLTHASNCIFIAGMGGKEIGLILENLIPQLEVTSKIVISPHRKIIELRQKLHSMDIGLIKEEVKFEDGQFYQILCLSKTASRKVSLYGDDLWESETGKLYREHQIKHFGVHNDEISRLYVEHLRALNS